MEITGASIVADVATSVPATIRVFQEHQIDFCCGGKRPITEACAERALDVDTLVGQLRAAGALVDSERNWQALPLSDLMTYIQARFHRPLRDELPRLGQMMAKVVSRHGATRPETLPLRSTFVTLQSELLEHMAREDAVLFPAIIALEDHRMPETQDWTWIERPIGVMELEHASAGAALARIVALTNGYVAPDGACPTFRGLYHGLAELERDMHEHVHLENNVLFPRAALLARRYSHESAERVDR